LDILEIPFETFVPHDIAFFQAHFKLDLIRIAAGGFLGRYPAIVDLDMLLLSEFSTPVRNLFSTNLPCVYEISDQVMPAYGYERISKDLTVVSGISSPLFKWYGGEFIAAPPEFYCELWKNIKLIYKNYLNNYTDLHHVGDEIVVSAALNRLTLEGNQLQDIGMYQGIGRWWSDPPLHPQRPLEWHKQCSLLHLPGDKYFLNSLRGDEAKTRVFGKYKYYRLAKTLSKIIYVPSRRLINWFAS
jgi:hypothetical protein